MRTTNATNKENVMRTAQSTNTKGTKQPLSTSSEGTDAIALLTEDHEHVKALFEQFENLSDRAVASKRKLATQICQELIKHTTVEEEIFYPAVRNALPKSDQDMMDEALVEHQAAKDLIEQILDMDPSEDLYDAKVKVLSEMIEHHVEEEEQEMFKKARESRLDMEDLGLQISERKASISL
jgi:hemerythrin superfamily protein